MKRFIDKVNSSYNIAIIFFLFAGSAFFIHYSLSASKYVYILLSVIIYSLGALVRKYLFKTTDNKGYTEAGIFFISFLLTAYILYLSNVDKAIGNYLPDKILLQAGSSFFFILLISFFSALQKGNNKFIIVLLIIVAIVIIQFNQGIINALFLSYPQVSSFIIGMPLAYLIYIVFGLSGITRHVSGNISYPRSK